jgi:hypothetical protein
VVAAEEDDEDEEDEEKAGLEAILYALFTSRYALLTSR